MYQVLNVCVESMKAKALYHHLLDNFVADLRTDESIISVTCIAITAIVVLEKKILMIQMSINFNIYFLTEQFTKEKQAIFNQLHMANALQCGT